MCADLKLRNVNVMDGVPHPPRGAGDIKITFVIVEYHFGTAKYAVRRVGTLHPVVSFVLEDWFHAAWRRYASGLRLSEVDHCTTLRTLGAVRIGSGCVEQT